MRLLLGMVLGAALTVGGAYLYDAQHDALARNAPTRAERPLVNWEVVAIKWHRLATRARAEWSRIGHSS